MSSPPMNSYDRRRCEDTEVVEKATFQSEKATFLIPFEPMNSFCKNSIAKVAVSHELNVHIFSPLLQIMNFILGLLFIFIFKNMFFPWLSHGFCASADRLAFLLLRRNLT